MFHSQTVRHNIERITSGCTKIVNDRKCWVSNAAYTRMNCVYRGGEYCSELQTSTHNDAEFRSGTLSPVGLLNVCIKLTQVSLKRYVNGRRWKVDVTGGVK